MRNYYLLLMALILSIVLYYIRSSYQTTSFYNEINITDVVTNNTSSIDIENYVIGVVAAEMPASFNDEALKAQAIAARTFLYYNLMNNPNKKILNDISFQAYITPEEMKEKWLDDYELYYNKISKIVLTTKDLVITFNNKPISSYYFSMSNGYTESALNVFNEDKPYLISVESNENTNNSKYEYTIVISKQEFLEKLNDSSSEIIINNIIKDNSNRIETIVINNKKYTGIEVRKALNLRSTDFEINIDNENVLITTRGYGHGVGMSQYGANEMAKKDKTYIDIIKHYYTNVEIKNINSIKL